MKGDSEGLLKLPTDKALLDDPKFRPYVELYAKVTWACGVVFSLINYKVRTHFHLGHTGVNVGKCDQP